MDSLMWDGNTRYYSNPVYKQQEGYGDVSLKEWANTCPVHWH